MQPQTEREFIRITHNEPLALVVSPLSDFLWEDFVRDARPMVTYLIDRYHINQLSRFGKELFDYLYNGKAITPVVSLHEVDDYFYFTNEGKELPFPEGYKPENAFWLVLMTDIINAPGWPHLVELSVGDQFNAGNNSINILNELSEYISQQIDDGSLDIQLLLDGAEELRNLRNTFLDLKEKGNLIEAAEVRKKGKQIGKDMEERINEYRHQLQPELSTLIDSVCKKSDDIQKALSSLAGMNPGTGARLDNLEEKKKLASKLHNNKSLRSLIRQTGSLRQAWSTRLRARTSQTNYSDIVGAKFSDEATKAFPIELALAGSEEGQALFALKYSQKTLLTKDYEAKVKELDKGPIILYIDISGSMMGKNELWSKALALVISEDCLRTKREIEINLFDSKIQKTITLSPQRKNNEELLDFILAWVTRGGTSFAAVVDHALTKARMTDKADVLLITDGQASVPDPFIRRLNQFKQEHGIQWSSFCLGRKTDTLMGISDSIHSVNIEDDPETASLFQSALRY